MDHPVHEYIQAVVTVLSLVNPMICVAMLASVTADKPPAGRFADATKAALAILMILCLAALGGQQLLKAFGISLPAFQVAGGAVLVWMGFNMLRGGSQAMSASSASDAGGSENAKSESSSLAPLILFAASPGTITGVITLSISHKDHDLPVTALVAVFVAVTVTWLLMIVATKASGHRKPSLVRDISTRFMGLIVLAMGIQFALSGLHEFFRPQ